MFFSWLHYSTRIFPFQGAFLLKKYEGDKNIKAKIVQNKQLSARDNIESGDVLADTHTLHTNKKRWK